MTRQERIERLLSDLRYEIERGMMEGDVDEHLRFRFIVPTSRTFHDGAVECRFETRPVKHARFLGIEEQRLRVVK
jgi:hypothetical protein